LPRATSVRSSLSNGGQQQIFQLTRPKGFFHSGAKSFEIQFKNSETWREIFFYQKFNSKILNINTKEAIPLTSLSCVHATGYRSKFQFVENIFFYFGTNCGKQNNYITQKKDFSAKYSFLS